MNKLPTELLKEINLLKEKKDIIEEIDKFLSFDKKKKEKVMKNEELKKKEFKFLKDKKFYRDLIFISKSENVLDEIDLEIIFCNGNIELIDIWKYFKVMSSSAHTSDDAFGCIKLMIKDKNTNKYIGILELGNDIYSCEARDTFIGWTKDNKKESVNIDNNLKKSRLSFIVNITCCIGLQPMAHNLNIGKLLVMTVFTKDVMEYFKKIRGYYYAGVTTFGLYGKSIQYDRLKEIKYIGETKGSGTSEFSISLYEKIRDFVKEFYPIEYFERSNMSSSKMRILQFGLNVLGYDQKELLNHGIKRGIYFGYTSKDSKDFFNGKKESFDITNIKTFSEIVQYWKERWSINRLKHVLNTNRFKVSLDLKDFTLKERKNEYSKQYNFTKSIDENWLKNKKDINKDYYNRNKDNSLKELEININGNTNEFIGKEYLGGFFDSDGSIYISNNVLFIGFSQCVLNILLSIQYQYGGTLYKREKRNDNQREQYTLRIVGLNTEKILNDLIDTSILKKEKVKKGLEFIKHINKQMNAEKQCLIDYIKLNKKEDNELYFENINWKYIAGFFDGDGCITLNYHNLNNGLVSPTFSIAQKYTPKFLNYLKMYMSNSLNKLSLSKHCISTGSKKLIEYIYDKIKNYLIVKKYQFNLLIEIFNEYDKGSEKDMNKIKELGIEIKNNKHQTINYDIDIKQHNSAISIKNNIDKKIEMDNVKEIDKLTTNILLSEKKMGINNPNYGKHLSNEHALNIAIETTKTKRAHNPNLSDEKIIEIYNLKDKMMQKDVAEKYGMNREMIRRIWNKNIVPINSNDFIEKKQEKIIEKINGKNNISDLTNQQKTSIGKRTLSINEILEIINWKIKALNNEKLDGKKIYSTNLSNYLTKEWSKKVTVDIIKNIWNGRTKLFQHEFENKDITYEYYLEIIEK